MIRKICFGLLIIILGTLVEHYTHFFTNYASVFYGILGMTWGLFFGLRAFTRENGGRYHE